MDQFSLSYYKTIPKDLDEDKLRCPSAENRQHKPKASVPIKKILSVNEVQEDDKKKFKKLTKAADVAFKVNNIIKLNLKVCFAKKYQLKKEYIPNQDEDDDLSDEDLEGEEDQDDSGRTKMVQSSKNIKSKSKARKDNKKAQNLATWYFVCDNKIQQQLMIEFLTVNAQQQNPKFIADKALIEKITKNHDKSNIIDEDDDEEEQHQSQDEGDEEVKQALPKKTTNQNAQKNNQSIATSKKQDKESAISNSKKSLNQTNNSKNKTTQQIDLFNKNKNQNNKGQEIRSRTDSEISDLNQVLQQNLNINNVNLDADGNINDINANLNDDDDDNYELRQNFEDNQDAKEKVNKLRNKILRYYNQSLTLQEKKTKKEQKGWDLKFQNYWGYLINSDKNFKDSMTLSEKFFDHIGKFRKTAQKLVKEIVDELHKPVSMREHKPLQKVSEELNVFLDDEDIIFGNSSYSSKTLLYYEKNICLKITHQGEQMMDTNHILQNAINMNATTNQVNNSGYGDNSMNTQQQNKNADQFQNLKWKLYGREFLSMDVMFDTLYLLSKPDASHKLRVPLSATVDYKGFRALAIASIPIQPQLGPSIGFYTDGKQRIQQQQNSQFQYQSFYVPHDHKLKQELIYIGDVLNLKENRISQKGQSQFESVPVSFFIKIYNYQQPEGKNKGKDPDTPTKKSQDYHFSDLQYIEEPFYVLKTSEIFPLDTELNELQPKKDKYLRPEFVCSYERPLKADAKKDLGFHVAKDTKTKDDEVNQSINQKFQNDQVDLNQASRYLKNNIIPYLVDLLDSLFIMPIDSESLEIAFHSQGVNMRYLGQVTQQSIVPHSLTTIYSKQIAAMILDHQRRFAENEEARENLKRQWNNRHYMSNASLNNQGKRSNQLNQQTQQQEYEQKDQQLQEEWKELQRNMDDSIKMAIVDYINLVFGAGKETEDFWNEMLIPYASAYYNFSEKELEKGRQYLNALFFAFSYHFGIKIVRPQINKKEKETRETRDDRFQVPQTQKDKDDDFFKEFGKSEQPFGSPEKSFQQIEIVGRSKTYGLRNQMYKLISDKFREYKAEGKIENALKACKMKRLMKRLLEDKEDVSTMADICEIALDHNDYKIAKDQAMEGLKHAHPLHAEAIKFYCILMRAFYGMDFNQEADQYFSRALATLDHHWGPFHPLHTTIYGIMAYLLIQKNKMEEARYLYSSSQLCCLRVLGPNHIQTADVHMDFGRLFLKMKNKDEALQHFEIAYLIYESQTKLNVVNALSTANAAMQVATILEEQGKLNDAFKYAQISSETYRLIHGDESENTIFAQFLQLSISYSLKHPDVVQQCEKLYDQLTKRDNAINNYSMIENQVSRQNDAQKQDFEEKITKIKELCVAATLLHMTRSLISEDKQAVKSYCDKVLFRAHQEKGNLDDDDSLPNLADLHQRIDQHKIMTLSNLKFDDSGKNFLLQLYDIAKDQQIGSSLVEYYQKILDGVIAQVREEQKKQQNQGAQSAKPNAKMGMNTFLQVNLIRNEQNILADNWPVTDEPKEFFKRLIKAFEHINFYNVLIL